MKSFVFALLSCLSFTVCTHPLDGPEIKSYGWTSYDDSTTYVVHRIADFSSSESLFERYRTLSCSDSILVLSFDCEGVNYQVKPFPYCPIGQVCIRNRNVFWIREDCVEVDFHFYEKEVMNSILNIHYHNNGSRSHFSEKASKVVLAYQWTPTSFANFETELIRIIEAYEAAQVEVPLALFLFVGEWFDTPDVAVLRPAQS